MAQPERESRPAGGTTEPANISAANLDTSRLLEGADASSEVIA